MPINPTAKLDAAIDAEQTRLARQGRSFNASDVARAAIQAMERDESNDEWPAIRDGIVLNAITSRAQRRIARAIRKTDPRQGWLALPEYERIPQLIELGHDVLDINNATLEQYRAAEAKVAARIRSYSYPRRGEKRQQRDKETLRQMRRLDKQIAPLMAGEPDMKIGRAIQMYRDSPDIQQRQQAIKRRWERRKTRTKNQ